MLFSMISIKLFGPLNSKKCPGFMMMSAIFSVKNGKFYESIKHHQKAIRLFIQPNFVWLSLSVFSYNEVLSYCWQKITYQFFSGL